MGRLLTHLLEKLDILSKHNYWIHFLASQLQDAYQSQDLRLLALDSIYPFRGSKKHEIEKLSFDLLNERF